MPNDTQTTHDADEDIRNQNIMIYVNGDLVHRDAAKVSVYDSGFMLGDGMWEGMRLYRGKWAFFDAHMDRFFNSCKAVSLDVGMDKQGILDALTRTAEANGMTDDVHCRLMLTRGVKVKPFQHPSLSRSGPTMVIIMEHSKPVSSLHGQGIRLATVPQVRGLPMSQDAKYNSHSKLNCVIACLQAEQAGADEGLMRIPVEVEHRVGDVLPDVNAVNGHLFHLVVVKGGVPADRLHAIEVHPLVDPDAIASDEPVLDRGSGRRGRGVNDQAGFLLHLAHCRSQGAFALFGVALGETPNGIALQVDGSDQGDATIAVGDHAAHGEVVAHDVVMAE